DAEERFVPPVIQLRDDDGTADDKVRLLEKGSVVGIVLLYGCPLEEAAMHHRSALEEVTALAVKLVGAALFDENQAAGGGMAILGGHRAGDHFDLLDARFDVVQSGATIH